MESRTRRKSKNQENEKESSDLDRLSYLPDSILSHILSFLDTKTALRTSILSKRYKNIWTSIPCLDFRRRGSESFESYVCPSFYVDQNRRFVSVESCINDVLLRREDCNLTMFRLSLHQHIGSDFLEHCLDYAAKHKVQHLRIRAHVKRKPVALPRLLLNSTSLINLRLNNATSRSIELPKSVALPNLKTLQLKNFEFSAANYNGEVFLGCPNLEILILSKCWIRPGDRLKILDVNCLKLKNLEIRNWRSPWRCFDEHMINVDAPSLVSFTFEGYIARVNFKEGSPCLEKASIELSYPTACSMVNLNERRHKTSENLMSMLRQIRNVKFLSLSWKTIEVLNYVPDLRITAPSIFENLRCIKVTAEDECVELTLPIEAVMQLLKMEGSNDILVFDVFEILKLWPKCAITDPNRNEAYRIGIQLNVIHFLLESSPSIEFLYVEVPKVPSEES